MNFVKISHSTKSANVFNTQRLVLLLLLVIPIAQPWPIGFPEQNLRRLSVMPDAKVIHQPTASKR